MICLLFLFCTDMCSQFVLDLIVNLFYELIQWKYGCIFLSMQTEGNGTIFFLIESDNQKIRNFLYLAFTHTITKLLGSVV